MKKFIFTSILLAILATCTTILAQNQQEEYLGLPGDNLNLFAVMKLFQESETLEGFERNLNDKNSNINNLDLNGDNLVDYIRVIDYVDGDVHSIVLQVAVDRNENQDVAVFTVQRYTNGQVQIQLTGDEALYGRNYIIEPIFDDVNTGQTPNPGYIANTGRTYGRNVVVSRTTTFEIANWPLIRFIYLPSYVVWRSSWNWGYYPSYWHPWRPYYWHYYYGYHYNWYNHYYGHYRHWNNHRYPRWNNVYYSTRRSHSPYVSVRLKTGNYKNTYSHPSQRRKGEAMYAKMHRDRNTNSTGRYSGNSSARRSGSGSTTERKSAGNVTRTTRRSYSTVTNKSVTNQPSRQNAGTTRRSNTTVSNKSVANPATKQNTGTTRRSRTTVVNKSGTNPPSRQNVGTNRRTSGKPTKTAVSSSSRRKSESSKSNSNGKKKDSETSKTTRRK